MRFHIYRLDGTSVSALDIWPPRIFAVCSWVVNLNIMMGQFCEPEHAEHHAEHNQHREQSEHGEYVMKSNTVFHEPVKRFKIVLMTMAINKNPPCDNLRNLRNPCSSPHPVVRDNFKVGVGEAGFF